LAAIEDQSRRKYESGQDPLSFLPPLGTKEAKNEWTSETLEVAAAGCSIAIFIPQIQSYKIRNGIADGEMTPQQMAVMKQVLFPELEKVCRCVIDKVSSRWSFEEVDKDPAAKAYSIEVIQSGKCPLPSFE
jgi:hypothetical protein